MRWKIVLEGTHEFGSAHRSELTIDKDLERLSAGEIGFSVEDGKAIMAHLNSPVRKSGFQFVFVAMAITRAAGSPSMTAIRAKVRAVSVRRTRTMAWRASAASFGVPFP